MFKKHKTLYRIKFGRSNGLLGYSYYAILKKGLLFWHEVIRFSTFNGAKRMIDELREIEAYNETALNG